jgi:hypothetical protein
LNHKLNLSIKLLAVDSVKCYDSYQSALTALGKIPARYSINFKEGEDTAAAALVTFTSECALKASVDPCLAWLTANADAPTTGLGGAFTTACSIPSPTANAADCATAYDALIKAVEALTGARKVDMMASPVDEFNSFVTKCPLTSHTKVCYDAIQGISTVTGPVKNDLSKIQTNCNPVPKQPADSGDDNALHVFSSNLKIVLFIWSLFNICNLI